MSQAQEERRKQAWESHGEQAFQATFERLRDLKMEVEKLPEGSTERSVMQKKYDDEHNAAFEEYDKATNF